MPPRAAPATRAGTRSAGRGTKRTVAAAGKLVGEQPGRPKRSASAAGGSAASSPSVGSEPLQRLGQLGQRRARTQQRDRHRRQVGAVPALAPPDDDHRPAHPGPGRRRDRRKPRRGHPESRRHAAAHAAPPSAPLDPATVQPQQPVRVEAHEPRTLGLDRRPDRLQPHEQPLPASATPAGSGGTSVSRGQRASASPSRIPGWTPNASAASDTSPTCCTPRARAPARRAPGAARHGRRRRRELEAGEQDTDDHLEHMFAQGSDECPCWSTERGLPRSFFSRVALAR